MTQIRLWICLPRCCEFFFSFPFFFYIQKSNRIRFTLTNSLSLLTSTQTSDGSPWTVVPASKLFLGAASCAAMPLDGRPGNVTSNGRCLFSLMWHRRSFFPPFRILILDSEPSGSFLLFLSVV